MKKPWLALECFQEEEREEKRERERGGGRETWAHLQVRKYTLEDWNRRPLASDPSSDTTRTAPSTPVHPSVAPLHLPSPALSTPVHPPVSRQRSWAQALLCHFSAAMRTFLAHPLTLSLSLYSLPLLLLYFFPSATFSFNRNRSR